MNCLDACSSWTRKMAVALVGAIVLASGVATAAPPAAGQSQPSAAPATTPQPVTAQKPVVAPQPALPQGLDWHTDYGTAMRAAMNERKMLLIHFDGMNSWMATQFEQMAMNDPNLRDKLSRCVLARLPLDAKVQYQGQDVNVLTQGAFPNLQGQAGLAMIDMANQGQSYSGLVVSELPFTSGKYYSFRPDYLSAMLDLPAGTLTQRTMVFAVRIHPERPASVYGQFDPMLGAEANSHSVHQANIHRQGHHQWESRFHRISGMLPGGLRAKEVVAESWPNEGLLDAAVDCVASWRQSPGHWSAVSVNQPLYGYDIQRGSNGIWYGTGIFGTYSN
jgi:hypothetical protein